MSEEKVGEANAGFERYAETVKPPVDASVVASGIIRQAKEAGTKVTRCVMCHNSYTSKSVGEPCPFCAAAIKALVAWADAVKAVKAATVMLHTSTANTYPELWEREHAAIKDEAVKRDAVLAAADALTGEKTDG